MNLKYAIKQFDQIRLMMKDGWYRDCLALLDELIPEFEAAQDWERYIQSLNDRGKCLWKSNLLYGHTAEMEFNHSKAIQHLGELHGETARSYTNLGIAYTLHSKYEMALACYEKSLSINLQLFGENYIETAVNYNNIGSIYSNMGQHDKAIPYYHKGYDIFLQTLGENHPDIALTLKNLGVCYCRKGEQDKGLSYSEKALDIELQFYGEMHHETAKSYSDIGHQYYLKYQYEKALIYLKKSLSIRLEVLGELHPETAWSYHNLSSVYNSMRDSEMAIIYIEKCLHIRLQILGEWNMDTAWGFYHLGSVYASKGLLDESTEQYIKCMEIILRLNDESSPHLGGVYTNIGFNYNAQNNFSKAIEYHLKSLHLWINQYGETHPYVGIAYNNLGTAYKAIGEIDLAIDYFEKCLSNWVVSYGERHNYTAVCLHNLAIVHTEKAQFQSAYKYYQQALVSLLPDYSFNSFYTLPSYDIIVPSKELMEVFLSFSNDSLSCYNKNGHQELDFALSWYYSLHATQLIDLTRKSFRSEESKLALGKFSKEVYTTAVDLSWKVGLQTENNNLEKACNEIQELNPDIDLPIPNRALHEAFYCSEKSKSSVLLSSFIESVAKSNSGIPQPLLDEEQRLKLKLSALQNELEEEQCKKNEQQNPEQIKGLKMQIYDLKLKRDSLLSQFETDYPDYFLLKYQTNTVSVKTLQSSLPNDVCLLEYFISGNKLYTFAITFDNFVVLKSLLPEDFDEEVSDFLRFGVGTKGIAEMDKDEYLTLGFKLYQLLIAPVIEKLPLEKDSKLIIIPDGILSRLPFETLLIRETNAGESYSNLPYLLNEYEISYHFSATLWHYQLCKHSEDQIQPKPSTYLGIAPVYSNATNSEILPFSTSQQNDEQLQSVAATRSRFINGMEYRELIYSEDEVQAIQDLFSDKGATCKTLLHEEATISKFNTEAENYQFIHIAAHAGFRENQPELTGIIFSPDIQENRQPVFYLSDAFNLKIKADLVVLSCCESGIGEEKQGEGIFALNRGFLFAGAKNIVFTLYKVYDYQSSQLVKYFFKYVLEGKTYSGALRKAKQEMISNKNMPLFWSGYVLI